MSAPAVPATLIQPWCCTHCGYTGSAHHQAYHDSNQIWQAIKRRHALSSPDCAEKYQTSGIVLAARRVEVGHGQ